MAQAPVTRISPWPGPTSPTGQPPTEPRGRGAGVSPGLEARPCVVAPRSLAVFALPAVLASTIDSILIRSLVNRSLVLLDDEHQRPCPGGRPLYPYSVMRLCFPAISDLHLSQVLCVSLGVSRCDFLNGFTKSQPDLRACVRNVSLLR